MKKLTQKHLKTQLYYDEFTGLFTWLVNPIKAKTTIAGDTAGCMKGDTGYILIRVGGCLHRAHRLAWLYVHGEHPKQTIDHINQIKDDNRIVNLREADEVMQANNRDITVANKTGQKGVSLVVRNGKTRYCVKIHRKSYGIFDDIDEAKQVAINVYKNNT